MIMSEYMHTFSVWHDCSLEYLMQITGTLARGTELCLDCAWQLAGCWADQSF